MGKLVYMVILYMLLIYYHPSKHKHLDNICTMLDQRRRRWADVVQMLCKYFVFAGIVTMFSYQICQGFLPGMGLVVYKWPPI